MKRPVFFLAGKEFNRPAGWSPIPLTGWFVMISVMLLIMTGGVSAQQQEILTAPAPDMKALLDQLKGDDTFTADTAADALVAFGDAAVAPLLDLLDPSRRDACAGAMKALAAIGDTRAVAPIMTLLEQLKPTPHDHDTFALEYLRHEAIRSLGVLGDRKAIPLLRQAAESSDRHDRVRALTGLARLDAPDALPALAAYVTHEDAALRSMAVSCLGELGGDRVLEFLVRAVDDPQWFVRDAAAEALGKLDSRRARNALESLRRDPNPFVRRTAEHALKSMAPGEL
ncbi:HEAT repeat domain-containing protein [bacterium]|nr:HEAT repeat domain-containing protein [candidate division CSSED10-310 bacterium]